MPANKLPNGYSRVTRHTPDVILDASGKVAGFMTDTDDQFIASVETNPLTGGNSFSLPGGKLAPLNGLRTTPLRCATFGDSTANIGVLRSPDNFDVSQASSTAWQSGTVSLSLSTEKFGLSAYYPQAYLVGNGGISGQTTTQMVARDTLAASTTRKSTQDMIDLGPHVILLHGGSINDLTSVTAGTLEATIATTFANHCLIIQRFLAAGIPVVDSGIYGFSGSATDLAQTRIALVRLNAMFKAYAAQYPGRVEFVDPLGRVSDSTGAYLPGVSSDGTHLNLAGGWPMGQGEADALSRLFGQSSGARYQGRNVIANANLAVTGSQAYGTVGTGYSIGATNATRQSAKIENINGKSFQTCEFVVTGASNSGSMFMPFDPSAAGANMTSALNITAGDIYGFEFDFYIEPMNGATFNIGLITGRVDVRNSVGAGRIVLDALTNNASNAQISAPIQGHAAFQPLLFGDAQANLTNASSFSFLFGVVESSGTFKLGVSQPRIVKLGQAVTTI